jgi:hypothetical protein|tara:strand:- start:205 stop:456 length:252 start_codon:yes stop_codon:yes gene_type:complete
MTLAQNLGFSLSKTRLHRRQIERRVHEVASVLWLADALEAMAMTDRIAERECRVSSSPSASMFNNRCMHLSTVPEWLSSLACR